jgi:peroxiredoxin
MTERTGAARPTVAGRIGVTLLCVYLLGVTLRIGGCYAPDAARRDELPDDGPGLGAEFPPFRLQDVSGATIGRDDLRGGPAIVAVVPSLDWSPPTKARLLDLAEALRNRRDIRVVVVLPSAQATPRSATFVRDHRLPFHFLVDDAGLVDTLGLATPAPDGTPAAFPATFVLDDAGRVRFRDVRKNARTWPAPELVLGATSPPARAPAP